LNTRAIDAIGEPCRKNPDGERGSSPIELPACVCCV
jgi:hypothetical protein